MKGSFEFTSGADAIYGTKFWDNDGDGTFDKNEPGLDGVEIFVDNNRNGSHDEGEPSTYTDANGEYRLTVEPAMSVFATDFDDGIVPSEFSGVGSLAGVEGFSGLGNGTNRFGGNLLFNQSNNDQTVLTLTNLPDHESVDLKFLLAIIDGNWRGDNVSRSGSLAGESNPIAEAGFIIFNSSYEGY